MKSRMKRQPATGGRRRRRRVGGRWGRWFAERSEANRRAESRQMRLLLLVLLAPPPRYARHLPRVRDPRWGRNQTEASHGPGMRKRCRARNFRVLVREDFQLFLLRSLAEINQRARSLGPCSALFVALLPGERLFFEDAGPPGGCEKWTGPRPPLEADPHGPASAGGRHMSEATAPVRDSSR